jgi:hypothetical protein
MGVLQVHRVLLALAHAVYNKDIAAVLVKLVYRSMGVTCTGRKMSGTDGRLSFNDLKDLLLHLYITYRALTVNIASHSVKYFRLFESGINRKKVRRFGMPLFTYSFTCILTAPVACPFHSPKTEGMSANPINE